MTEKLALAAFILAVLVLCVAVMQTDPATEAKYQSAIASNPLRR